MTKLLFHSHYQAEYASGHMLFLRQSSLMAQPFDAKRFETTGEAVPIAEQVLQDSSVAHGWFSPSANGLLLYAEGVPKNRQLVWFDRDGKQVGAVPGDDAYAGIALSRDGKKLAYYLDGTGFDVWGFDIARGVKVRSLTPTLTAFSAVTTSPRMDSGSWLSTKETGPQVRSPPL